MGSILIVLAVLLFTFMSAGMPVLLIAVIEGAIWINFASPTMQKTNIVFFMSELIVSSIQMGANIDYAIVISGRFNELRDKMPKKEAIIETLNFAFPTIVTSGSMMALAGVFIGQLSSDGAISGIGQCLGRGTIISIFLVMFVLPQILLIGEKVIEKTSFKVSVPIKLDRGLGLMQVDGLVRGQVNGMVVGEMHAVVRGEVNALVSLGKMTPLSSDMEAELPEELKRINYDPEDVSGENAEDRKEAPTMFDIALKGRRHLVRVLTAVTTAGMIGSSLPGRICYADGYDAPAVSVNGTLSDNEARTRIDIYTEEDLAELAKNCHSDTWSEDKDVFLMEDISLSGNDFTNIPTFSGYFDGQGHTIRGYVYGGDGYVTGLFRYADEDAEIKDLTLMGTVRAEGDKEVTGGIVGINRGLVSRCKFVGSVEGKNIIGGIAAINEASGIIENCENQASISGYYFTGGITGKNYGLVNFCNNKGDINSSSEWVTGDDEMNENIINDLTGSGVRDVKVRSGIDTGGVAGYSKGILIRSSNDGTIGYPHTGYNVGGIAGRQSGIITSCVNRGSIRGRKDVGGVVGQMEPFLQIDDTESVSTSVDQLHDMIDDLLDDMDSGNATLGSDFDELKNMADSALDTSDELADNFEDYINTNTDTINNLGDRADDVTDMMPEVVDNVTAAADKADGVSDALG